MGNNPPSDPFCLRPDFTGIREGVSLFTAVKNRRDTLQEAITTWIAQDWIDEIVILDWDSADSMVPLMQSLNDPRIVLAEVRNQPRWILSHAYNLAARLTTRTRLLKMDADVKILEGFCTGHSLDNASFFTGNWATARDENEKHLHGVSYMNRADFFLVNGYNEFIKSYGWDDIDLYERLEKLPLTRRDIDHNTLYHIPHLHRVAHQDRMDFLTGISDTEKAILNSLVNRFQTEELKQWSKGNKMLRFTVEERGKGLFECRQAEEDPHIIPGEVLAACIPKAIIERFHDMGIRLSRPVLANLTPGELTDLYILFHRQQSSPDARNLFRTILAFNTTVLDAANQISQLKQELETARKGSPTDVPPPLPAASGSLMSIFRKKSVPGKVNLGKEIGAFYGEHRSGWAFAIASLASLHNPGGVVLDSFIERTFQWHPEGIRPHLEPWVGFIHVPPGSPPWFAPEVSNKAIFSSPAWNESLPYCKGLYTLSRYHCDILRKNFPFPVDHLLHPTEEPALKWDWDRYIRNPEKKVIQVGFWLRKLLAIYVLKAPGFQKCFIRKENVNLDHLLEVEKQNSGYRDQLNDEALASTTVIGFQTPAEYDRLLSENIVFIDLYDASANNSVIECMVRNTPILVNPLEPIIEYLGPRYPFYFRNLDEASSKLRDTALIRETHNYLRNLKFKKKLEPGYFLRSFVKSSIYKKL